MRPTFEFYTDGRGVAQAYYPLYVEPSDEKVDAEMSELVDQGRAEAGGCIGAETAAARSSRGRTITSQAAIKQIAKSVVGPLGNTNTKFKVLVSYQRAYSRLPFRALSSYKFHVRCCVIQGGKNIGTFLAISVPSSYENENDDTRIDTKTLSANLFHTIVRCLLVDGCWKASYTKVVFDSNPIAIPYCMLDQRTANEQFSNGLRFTCSTKTDDANSSKKKSNVPYVLNPAFCLCLLKLALTEGGQVPLEEAVQSDLIITCALSDCVPKSAKFWYLVFRASTMPVWLAGTIPSQKV